MKNDVELNTPAVKEYVQRASLFAMGPSPQANAVARIGNINAWFLLLHIAYWQEAVGKHKRVWIDHTLEEWLINTGLTRAQYYRARGVLEAHKLIVVDHRKKRKWHRSEVTHIKLADGVTLDALGKAPPSDKPYAEKMSPSEKQYGDPGSVSEKQYGEGGSVSDFSETAYNKKTEGNKETHNKVEATPSGIALPGEGFSGKVQEKVGTGKQAVPGSCSTPAALPVLVPHAAPLVKIGTSTPLPEVWQAIGEFFIGQTNDHAKADVRNGWVQAQLLRGTLPTEWSAKEWGHAKTLRESWQNHRSALVAFVCILRWEQFHHYCQKRAAKAEHWKLSGTPDLQCLVHFKTQAAEFMQRHLADMQAEMAEAEAKAAKEAATKLYRGRWYEAGSFTENHFAHWQYYSRYVTGRDNVLEQLPVDHPIKLEQLTELERDRALDVIIDAITVQCEANAPVDQLVVDHKITTEIAEGIREWFAGKSWAQDIRKADLQKIAA